MKTLMIAAAAALAVGLATSPASARMTCSGADMAKANGMVGGMYGEQRYMMDKELMAASTAMSKGDMRGCQKSMSKLEKMSMTKKKM